MEPEILKLRNDLEVLAKKALETLEMQQKYFKTPFSKSTEKNEYFQKCLKLEAELKRLADEALKPPKQGGLF